MKGECALHDLLGRQLVAANHRPVGRIEEFRAERRGSGWVSTGVYVGMFGLLERFDIARKLLFGGRKRGYFARWDQIDVSNPKKPRLRCSVEELEKL